MDLNDIQPIVIPVLCDIHHIDFIMIIFINGPLYIQLGQTFVFDQFKPEKPTKQF